MNVPEHFDIETLASLADVREDNSCVSLYIPMVKSGPETRQNAIRLRNVLREARDALAKRGVAGKEIDALLAPAHSLGETDRFRQHRETGLAVFVAPGTACALYLPLEFDELCVVADRFHLKRLFPWFVGDGRFYILALSQNAVRLLEGSRDGVRDVELDGSVPLSLVDALGEELTDGHFQVRNPNRQSGVFHGRGVGTDDIKPELRKFIGMLDKGIASYLHREGRDLPLVVAAVDTIAAMYREVSDHRLIMDGTVAGNPEEHSADALHDAAWPLVEPYFDQARRDSAERFGNALSNGTGATTPSEVVLAADEGRVDTLFVALGVRRWGRVDAEARSVLEDDEHAPGTEDLLDRAAVSTWRNGGVVYAVAPEDVPGDAPLAAIYRY